MKSRHEIEQKHSERNTFTFCRTENITDEKREASAPEFSSWTFIGVVS